MRSKFLLGAAAMMLAASAPQAFAQDDAVMKRLDQMQKMIENQQKQIESQKKEINSLDRALGKKGVVISAPAPEPVAAPAPPPVPSPMIETRLQRQDQKIDDVIAKFAATEDARRVAVQEQARPSVDNGRLSITSADGRFSAALRLTAQYDTGYYMQSAAARNLPIANGGDLSSGNNFRRAQLGLQGKVFGDFSYYVNIDYGSGGSSGTEAPGHIQQAYIEYDGLAPFVLRIGAHPPSTGLDDSYAATDQLFFERAAATDLNRNLAGGDGRDSLEVVYAGDDLYGSLALTGNKVQETASTTTNAFNFDEQQAAVGRVAYSPIVNADLRWVVSAEGTDVFRVADSGIASNSTRPFAGFKNLPEVDLDDNSTALVSAGSIADTTDAWSWNLESAVTYDNFLAQGGYYKFGADTRGALLPTHRGLGFDGWYAEASWVLTGESRGWSSANAAFTNPKPRENFSLDGGGWGALELAGRYSELDLNDNAGVIGGATPTGGIRGGDQRIVTLGLNWYPNPVLKFMLQLQNVQISHINGSAVAGAIPANGSLGQNFDTVALRSQIAF